MANRKRLNNLLIDGKPLPAPDSGVVITENDLDSEDTGRDESGYMHRLVLREKVKTWEFPYNFLSSEDYNYIKSLYAGMPEFPVSFWGTETTAYCSNISGTLVNAETGDWSDVTLKIIEC